METSQLMCCKSMDWFLYHRNLRHERVKGLKRSHNGQINPTIPFGKAKMINIILQECFKHIYLLKVHNRNTRTKC